MKKIFTERYNNYIKKLEKGTYKKKDKKYFYDLYDRQANSI
jgi:hypothetical protein